jgi:tetratricopeptide (TPR) repeat protein
MILKRQSAFGGILHQALGTLSGAALVIALTAPPAAADDAELCRKATRMGIRRAFVDQDHQMSIAREWLIFRESFRVAEACSHLIAKDPADAALYYDRGNAWLRGDLFDRAIADFDQAIRLNPKNVSYYYTRGNAYAAQAFIHGSDFRLAIPDLDQAIGFNPKEADYYYDRGSVYEEIDDHDRAIADFDQAIRLNPGNAAYYHSRASSWGGKKDRAREIADLDQAIKLDPQNDKYYFSRGLFYSGNDDDRMIADYSRAIDLATGTFKSGVRTFPDVELSQYHQFRGNAYEKAGDLDRAIADYDRALKFYPKSEEARLGRERAQAARAPKQ